MALAPSTRLGPYEVTALISPGGMGEIYRARDTKLDRDVALNVLPQASPKIRIGWSALKREAKVLAALTSPSHRLHDGPERRLGSGQVGEGRTGVRPSP